MTDRATCGAQPWLPHHSLRCLRLAHGDSGHAWDPRTASSRDLAAALEAVDSLTAERDRARVRAKTARQAARELRAELREAERQRDEALSALRHTTQELRRYLAAEATA